MMCIYGGNCKAKVSFLFEVKPRNAFLICGIGLDGWRLGLKSCKRRTIEFCAWREWVWRGVDGANDDG
jgi:hypothetical protein